MCLQFGPDLNSNEAFRIYKSTDVTQRLSYGDLSKCNYARVRVHFMLIILPWQVGLSTDPEFAADVSDGNQGRLCCSRLVTAGHHGFPCMNF